MTAIILSLLLGFPARRGQSSPRPLHGALIAVQDASAARIKALRNAGVHQLALELSVGADPEQVLAAIRRIHSSGVDVYYWIEVARNPAMADAHPEWMASLQGHPEWRRLFPNADKPGDGEVIKNYPWVPLYYQETFDAHLKRIAGLLKGLPAPKGIFLNDLQAAPSACGCGNTFCRWTTDYGPIATATRLKNDAAGRFIAEVKKLAMGARIIPVWLTECEEDEKSSHCADISCFTGACWYNYTEQLMPVASQCDTIGAMATYKSLGKDKAAFGKRAGWIGRAITSFADMPPKRKGTGISPKRIIAVLQGWDVSPEEIHAQVERCRESGAGGYLISYLWIDQGWEPRLYKAPIQPSVQPPKGQ